MSKWANTQGPAKGGGLASSLRASNRTSLSALADGSSLEGKSSAYADSSPSAMYSWDLASPATDKRANQDPSVFLSGSSQSPSSRYLQKSLKARGIRGKRDFFAAEHKVSTIESKGESKSASGSKFRPLHGW